MVDEPRKTCSSRWVAPSPNDSRYARDKLHCKKWPLAADSLSDDVILLLYMGDLGLAVRLKARFSEPHQCQALYRVSIGVKLTPPKLSLIRANTA